MVEKEFVYLIKREELDSKKPERRQALIKALEEYRILRKGQ